MKALIFGVTGQDGHYMKQLLESENIEVFGSSRTAESPYAGSIGDYAHVKMLVEKIKPDYLFHFAANSTAKHETQAILENEEAICRGTLNVLEAVKLYSPETKVFICGSALQFRNTGNPISEYNSFEPKSAYAHFRNFSVNLARYYREEFKLSVYIGYLFNHDSPLRSQRHLCKLVAESAKYTARLGEGMLILNTLEPRREFSYALDIVKGIWMFVQQDRVKEVVIGSGKAYPVKDFVTACFEKVGLKWEDHVLIRPNHVPDYDILQSDPETINKLGWETSTSFSELVDIMMQ